MRVISERERQAVNLSESDKPECPTCGAEPLRQAVASSLRDGALELVVLECRNCGEQHPVWF